MKTAASRTCSRAPRLATTSRQTDRRLLFLGAIRRCRARSWTSIISCCSGATTGCAVIRCAIRPARGAGCVTAEQRVFTNWYPFRLFNVGGAVFADVGRTWGANPGGTESLGLLKDVGFGLRFGNSRSALGNVLHVDVAAPLDGGSDIEEAAVRGLYAAKLLDIEAAIRSPQSPGGWEGGHWQLSRNPQNPPPAARRLRAPSSSSYPFYPGRGSR